MVKPQAKKRRAFRRWSVRDGLLAFDGYIFDDEDAWKVASRTIVRALNAARVVLPKRGR